MIVNLIEYLLRMGLEEKDIGVISLCNNSPFFSFSLLIYLSLHFSLSADKSQVNKLRTQLQAHPACKGHKVEISTVDAFQGAERDIIILSSVRTRHQPLNEFIDSDKRINVAVSRAKRHLFLFGHIGSLRKNLTWGKVIKHFEGASFYLFKNLLCSSSPLCSIFL